MTPTEMDEAVKRAQAWLDADDGQCEACADRAGGCTECLIARALLAVVEQEKQTCAVLDAFAGNLAQMRERAAAAEQRALDAAAQVARLEALAHWTTAKLAVRDRNVATTERARVVEAIAAGVAGMSYMKARDLGLQSDAAEWHRKQTASYIRSHNWAAPEEES